MKVAIIHYWLVNMRGGEKTLESFLKMFPDAHVFTHVYLRSEVSDTIKSHRIFTSFINCLPFAKKLYQLYLPLMPSALIGFNLQNYDLVISSEAGPAKGIVPNPNAYHICYCHSPMRYIWDMYHEYFGKTNKILLFFIKCFIPYLRSWDVTSSNLVDKFITNSNYVAKRILRTYNRNAEIVFGPASIYSFLDLERKPEDYYLFFGQITKYKRLDIAIEACINSNRKLVVAGAGSIKKYRKNPLIFFLGRVSNEKKAELFTKAKALLFPGIEDMGLIPIEANAAGFPVIAYRDGGVLDTIKENATGIFFDKQNALSLSNALERFEKMESEGLFSERKVFSDHVKQFSPEAFREKISRIISERKRV